MKIFYWSIDIMMKDEVVLYILHVMVVMVVMLVWLEKVQVIKFEA